ncbi:DEAD/DEAH box helicase [Caldimonas tepidiphila]|uniref:DEAD/DEAH box helicase n=1 Tax=Caldimonas tepidiphila TaxID=2315841 RepID=UPI001F0C067F|nr:DEAD/DEAH box helicase [Caldimonas tepidiphila]
MTSLLPADAPAGAPSTPDSPAHDAVQALQGLERAVLRLLALVGQPRTRTWIWNALRHIEWRRPNGSAWTQEEVREALTALRMQRLAAEAGVAGYWQPEPACAVAAFADALGSAAPAELRRALLAAEDVSLTGSSWYRFRHREQAALCLRLWMYTGASLQELVALLDRPVDAEVQALLSDIAAALAEEALFARLHPEVQGIVCVAGLSELDHVWARDKAFLARMAPAVVPRLQPTLAVMLRVALAQHALLAGRPQQALDCMDWPQGQGNAGFEALAAGVRAGVQAVRGEWDAAIAGFEQAFKGLAALQGRRKQLLPASVAWLYPLALMARQAPAQLERAIRFCASEAGSRNPPCSEAFGTFWHVLRMRTGDAPASPGLLAPRGSGQAPFPDDLWRWLALAWLRPAAAAFTPSAAQEAGAQLLARHLRDCDLGWLADQLDEARRSLRGEATSPAFFVPPAAEGWRTTLAALAAIGDPAQAEGKSGPAAGATRLVWSLRLDRHGHVADITVLEQKLGVRGWGKPRELPLSRLAATERLEPHDARVARAVRSSPYRARSHRIDRAAAIGALVGHPHVVFDDRPEQFVDLVEAAPEIDVVSRDGRLQVRVLPQLDLGDEGAERAENLRLLDADERREAEALRLVTVLRDGPQRARVIRLSPAQRRAVQLIGRQLSVPREAQLELQGALRSIAPHFQVHADAIEAAREVAADARLRAELTPAGEGLQLRLVVAPLGPDGPRLAPGQGRARLIAAVKGETLGAQRELKAERRHLDAVLEALAPACAELAAMPEGSAGPCEWRIDSPDEALAVVEALPRLDAALSGIDWPKGRAVQVITAGVPQLQVRVRSAADWFTLGGELRIEDERVATLEQLLAWSTEGKGRFVPLGEGRFLALTAELRARVQALAAVGETQRGATRVPALAAAWLRDELEGAALEADAEFEARLRRLDAAQQAQAPVPPGLLTELRPYQEEGLRWALRLAQAGLGACLADDMGLGKTVQALAVLLARAAAGAALVVAPTSLVGNWQAEAARLAPSLRVSVYGDGDTLRADQVREAGAGDVLLVSYALLQQSAEAFAAREWHTLVVDEAQAIKNALAKRSQAVHELRAGFRLALSGTPIENRLSELWSVMRFANPGLLGTPARFNERFAIPIERERDRDAQRTLRRLIAPFVLRRTKGQVLDDLPPRTEQLLRVEPGADEAAHYELLRRQALLAATESLGQGGGQAQFNILAQLTRLRRAACDPRLVNPELGLVGAKVQAFAQLAAELGANRHKTLVFSQFVDFLALLRAPLDAAGIPYQYLDGATPAAERMRRVDAFQAGEGDFFLISLKAGGYGLNLTAADYVVIADPWWNPAAEDQAMGRAHRMGQQRPVTVYRLVARGTLEERIVALHHDKRALAEGVLDGGEGAALPSAEELVALIREGA